MKHLSRHPDRSIDDKFERVVAERDDLAGALAETEAERDRAEAARDGLADALADCVTKAVEYGEQDGGFVAFYLLPTGPIHRAIALLQQHGITVRPGFDGRGKAAPVKGAGRA